jgi:hypothetical protein
MSLIKANAVQVGQSTTATQNFTLAVPSSPDGTIKLARGNSGATTQDVMSVSNAGVVSFPQGLGNISNSTAIATGSTTARSLANRFADVVNVKDFGAVGDGVTDDTAAIQTAINAATGKQLILPSGTYKISGTLILLNSIYIVGYGQCTLQQSQANTTIIRIGDGTLANRRGDFSIENLTFTTTSSAAWTSAYVIDVQFAFFIEFKNLDIFGYVSSVKKMWGGIRLFKAMRFKAERCFMRGLIGDCVYTLGETGGLNYCIDLTFENCYFDDFVGNGFYFDDFTLGTFLYNCVMVSSVGNSLITYDISSSEKSNHYVYGLNAEAGGTMNGILINSASLVQIQNGWFQVGSTKNAIYLGPNATGIQIQGLWTTEGRWLIEGKNISITDGYIGSLLPDSSYAMTIDGASGKSNAVDIRSTTIDQFTGGGINLLNQPVRVSINGVRFFSVSQPYINGSNYTGGPIIEGVASNLQINGSQFVTAANTMSFGYGREMWQITGATLIQNITAQAPGRRLYLQAGTGGITFTTGGNIQFNTAALNQFNVVEFICDGTTWFEIGR